MRPGQDRREIDFSVLASIDQGSHMFNFPFFSGSDFPTGQMASAIERLEHAEFYARGNRRIRRLSYPLGNGSTHALAPTSGS